MSSRPCWFIATQPCPPNGHLKLGNIISNPSNPEIPLYESPNPLPISERIETFRQRGAHLNHEKSTAAPLGIATSFLSFLSGVGVDFNTKWSQKYVYQLSAREMTTTSFLPSPEFIESVAAQKVVQSFIRRKKFASLYMVVGVMVASGASPRKMTSVERNVGFHVNVDGTMIGAPAGVGPEVGFEQVKMSDVGSEETEDFVFAFRLRKLKIRKGEATLKMHYKSGGLFDKDAGKEAADKEREEREKSIVITVDGLADGDVTGQDVGLEETETQDETSGQDCLCVMPE
ncbi:uncharacterized protein BKA78DRAFT_292239 [Phyllosticta capitalensis]|uniref:uncharacterized protein n=1 Tax=Phyllosticta capitalensis TaxID=121624 RepID=UPI00312D7EFE